MRTLRTAYRLLEPHEKRRVAIMCGIVLVVALFELFSVLAIVPLLGLLADPDGAALPPALRPASEALGLAGEADAPVALGALFVGLLMLAAIVRSIGTWALNRFVQNLWRRLATRLLETYLRHPYPYFLDKNSSDLSKSILNDCQIVLQQVFMPAARILEFGAVFLAMLALLVFADPLAAAVVFAVLGGAYLSIFAILRRPIQRIGARRVEAAQRTFRVTAEVFGAIKEIKLRGDERTYLERFAEPADALARSTTRMVVVGRLPKYLIELLAIGGMIGFAITLLRSGEAGAQTLQLVGLYALAGYRMLPALQAIYEAFTQIGAAGATVEALLGEVEDRDALPAMAAPEREGPEVSWPLALDAVSFAYPGSAGRGGLRDVSLEIGKGATVGVVGTTGAGKTTFVDLILGLLTRTEGAVTLGGAPLEGDVLARWQAQLAYVPQDVFLFDASIAQNIALAPEPDGIDMDRVREAARIAQLDGYVAALPEGYATEIGEKGVRLSGGQRQRIGIARALHSRPRTLVLDEATSALDVATEAAVIDGIHRMRADMTIVQITHRLSTIRHCDRIFVFDEGRLAGAGTHAALERENPVFRRLMET